MEQTIQKWNQGNLHELFPFKLNPDIFVLSCGD
jgi:hypothetical protein